MAEKRKSRMGKVLIQLLLLVPTLFSFANNITSLIAHEARVAGKSLVMLIIFSLLLAILMTTTWIGLLAILFMYLVSLQLNAMLAMLIVVILNIILCGVIILNMSKIKNRLFFPMTSERCRSLCRTRRES